MNVAQALLGFLEASPSHGYTLKQYFDAHFGSSRDLKFGQVYSTLARLERDGLVEVAGVETGDGPERKLYAITPAGVSGFETWLSEPESAGVHTPGAMYAKVTLALLNGRNGHEILDRQRTVYLGRLRELAGIRRGGDLAAKLAADYETFHIKADLQWIETAIARLAKWETELTEGVAE